MPRWAFDSHVHAIAESAENEAWLRKRGLWAHDSPGLAVGSSAGNNDRQKGNGMRFVVMMVLVVASGVAVADWTKVATTESDTDIYVDRATISKSGNLARMWILEDRKVADTFSGKTFLSAKLHYEYDCKDNQRRVLQSSLYSGHKAGGSNVQTGTKAGPWRPISSGRVSETMWKIACGRK